MGYRIVETNKGYEVKDAEKEISYGLFVTDSLARQFILKKMENSPLKTPTGKVTHPRFKGQEI